MISWNKPKVFLMRTRSPLRWPNCPYRALRFIITLYLKYDLKQVGHFAKNKWKFELFNLWSLFK